MAFGSSAGGGGASGSSRTAVVALGGAAAAWLALKAARTAAVWGTRWLLAPPVGKYAGNVALVTGASEGLGAAIAMELAKQGLHVALVARSQRKLDATKARIAAACPGIEVKTFTADLTDTNSYARLVSELDAALPPSSHTLSVVVCNAGGLGRAGAAGPRAVWEYSEEEAEEVARLNGSSCMELVRRLLPRMLRAGRGGAVVACSSVASIVPGFLGFYGAEKARMNCFISALHAELAGTGITAQSMILGAIITPAAASFFAPPSAAAASAAHAPGKEEDGAARDARIAATIASIKPTLSRPSAENVARAIVQATGRRGIGGEPVTTPHFGHWLSTLPLSLWPPELEAFLKRRASHRLRGMMLARMGAGAGAGGGGTSSSSNTAPEVAVQAAAVAEAVGGVDATPAT